MATKNPFGNLRINRDDDDDQDMILVTPKNTTSASNFTSTTEMKKKKKVRPEEKRKNEEIVEESTEGFEVVGKTNKKPYTQRNNGEEATEYKKENKVHTKGKERTFNKTRPQKRQYERHSGTGRGKETAKNGAGGRTVWGDNSEQIARQAKNYGTRDDYCKLIIFYLFEFFSFETYLTFFFLF